jgi:predicted phosphodiesterase
MKLIKLKSNQKWAVISDTHIGHSYENTEHLQKILDDNFFIVFCGDVFELFSNKWQDLSIGKAAWLVDWMRKNPKRFVYVVGNHDADLWEEEDGLFFPIYETVKVEQTKKTFLCIHGHQFDRLNRHRSNPWGRFVTKIEVFFSRIIRRNVQDLLARKLKIPFLNRFLRRVQMLELRETSQSYASISGCDYLIHGHSHYKDVNEFNNHTIIDIGGFMIGESWLEVENGKPDVKIIK